MMKKMTPSNGQKGQLPRSWAAGDPPSSHILTIHYYSDARIIPSRERARHYCTFWRTNFSPPHRPHAGSTPAPATTSVPSWGKLLRARKAQTLKLAKPLGVGSWILTRNQSLCMLERMLIIRVAVRRQPVIVVPALFKSGRRYESL